MSVFLFVKYINDLFIQVLCLFVKTYDEKSSCNIFFLHQQNLREVIICGITISYEKWAYRIIGNFKIQKKNVNSNRNKQNLCNRISGSIWLWTYNNRAKKMSSKDLFACMLLCVLCWIFVTFVQTLCGYNIFKLILQKSLLLWITEINYKRYSVRLTNWKVVTKKKQDWKINVTAKN